MARQVVWLLVSAGLCATALPGCAHGTGNLLQGDGRPKAPLVVDPQKVRMDLYPGVEEAEPNVTAPPRPADTQLGGQTGTLPPGHRVPEFTGPPQVLPPRPLPPTGFPESVSLPMDAASALAKQGRASRTRRRPRSRWSARWRAS